MGECITMAKTDDEAKHFRLEIGARLWALRKFHGMSQRTFSESINLRISVYSKWELGYTFPSEINVRDICNVYDIDFNYIYGGVYSGIKENTATILHALIWKKIVTQRMAVKMAAE